MNIFKKILGNSRGTIGVVTNESSIALTVESTEGTVTTPASGADYIEVLADSLELQKTREEISRDTLSGTTEQEASRTGIPDVTGAMAVEFRASATEGAYPQALEVLTESLMGGKRTAATKDTTTGNTSTVLTFASHSYLVGDIVMVKEAGAFECRPISAVDSTTITFPFALSNGAPSDGVTVSAVSTFYSDTANSTTFSAEHNVGGEIVQTCGGLRTQSMSLENWSAGTVPSASFSVAGLSLERADGAPSYAPVFTADALPPVALEACLWVNGTKTSYTELGLNIENEVSFMKDACQADGKLGSRVTSQSTTFNATVYSDDTSLTTWDNFNNNDDVSIFFYAFNPTGTAGEFSEAVAGWLPQGKITELPYADTDGIVSDALTVKCHRNLGSDSVFLGFN